MNAENIFRIVYEKERQQRYGVGLGSRGSMEERNGKDFVPERRRKD
jgi:hypothetical protein